MPWYDPISWFEGGGGNRPYTPPAPSWGQQIAQAAPPHPWERWNWFGSQNATGARQQPRSPISQALQQATTVGPQQTAPTVPRSMAQSATQFPPGEIVPSHLFPQNAAAYSQMPTPPPSGLIPGTESGVRGPTVLPGVGDGGPGVPPGMRRLSGGAFASNAFTLPGNEAPAAPTGQSSGTGDPTYDAITRLISNRLMGPQFYGMGGHLFTEPDVGAGLLTRLAEQRSANQTAMNVENTRGQAARDVARIQNQGQNALSPNHRIVAYQTARDEILRQNPNLANSPQVLDEMTNRQIDRMAGTPPAQPAVSTPAPATTTGQAAAPATPVASASPAGQSPLTAILDSIRTSRQATPQAALSTLQQSIPDLPQQAFSGNNWPQILAALEQRFGNVQQHIAPPSPLLATTPGVNILSRWMDPAFMPFARFGQQPTNAQIWLNTLRQNPASPAARGQ